MSSDEIVERYLADVRAKADQYAVAKSHHAHLDHYRHVLLAEQMVVAERGGCSSVAAQDRFARASEDYRKFLDVLREAHERAIKLEWSLKISEWTLELYRTQEATRRVEARHYGLG
jgi:hypothetical protein